MMALCKAQVEARRMIQDKFTLLVDEIRRNVIKR